MRTPLLALACALLVSCRTAHRTTPEERAYRDGAADAAKRLYWARQSLEDARSRPSGAIRYYTFVAPGSVDDGRRLAPETVSVPVFVPAPLP